MVSGCSWTKRRSKTDPSKPRRKEIAGGRGQNPPPAGPVIVCIASAVKTPHRKAKRAAAAAFFGQDDERNLSLRAPAHWTQNTLTAGAAVAVTVLRNTDPRIDLEILSASPAVRDAMTKHLKGWEDEGWVGVKNRQLLQALAAELRKRTGTTSFRVVDGNRNVTRASQMANEACDRADTTNISLAPAEGYHVPGVKLAGTRQRVFYQTIRERKDKKRKPRGSSDKRIKMVIADVLRDYDRAVSAEDVWVESRTKDISEKVRNYFWRNLHDSFRLGRDWEVVPECEHFGTCPTCECEETLQHILLECKEPGQSEIWAAAKKLWLKKNKTWPVNSLGAILGCAMATFKNSKGKPAAGSQRLFRILVSESAFLIWKLRNERRINPDIDTHSKQEVINRWYAAINARLDIDRVLARRPAKGALPSLNPSLVLETWSSVIQDANVLPYNWLREPRVLVGPAREHRPNGRNR
ncbi:hypothetical protein C8F01DRAFT_994543 [Mycena amicta]|nr:hypothetical protein C8F01DRAFT_994543 [Mycena amicta]